MKGRKAKAKQPGVGQRKLQALIDSEPDTTTFGAIDDTFTFDRPEEERLHRPATEPTDVRITYIAPPGTPTTAAGVLEYKDRQVNEALTTLRMRGQLAPDGEDDAVAVQRAANILRAAPSDSSSMRVLGVAPDPS